MEFKDYYQGMGVDKKATQNEIKRAYRKLAKIYFKKQCFVFVDFV